MSISFTVVFCGTDGGGVAGAMSRGFLHLPFGMSAILSFGLLVKGDTESVCLLLIFQRRAQASVKLIV